VHGVLSRATAAAAEALAAAGELMSLRPAMPGSEPRPRPLAYTQACAQGVAGVGAAAGRCAGASGPRAGSPPQVPGRAMRAR
jgi:hypothetical protein